MRNITDNFKNNLNKNLLFFTKCYKLILKDETILGFTEYYENIDFENITYRSNFGFSNKTLKSKTDLSFTNENIIGFIDNDMIKIDDIVSGKFNNAEIEIFLLDYKNFEKLILLKGYVKDISIKDNIFIAEINSISSLLENTIGQTYSPTCRCLFCDENCSLNKSDYTSNGVISEVINQFEFRTLSTEIVEKDDYYYNDGLIKILDGNNRNQLTEIKMSSKGYIVLRFKFSYEIKIGDEFEITAGCDKNFKTCCSKFDNAINFRGEPNLPRSKKLFKIY